MDLPRGPQRACFLRIPPQRLSTLRFLWVLSALLAGLPRERPSGEPDEVCDEKLAVAPMPGGGKAWERRFHRHAECRGREVALLEKVPG